MKWIISGDALEVTMKGRMIGGCFDVLLNLVGTKYDLVKGFVDKYKEDGILWYLESFSLDVDSITRGLWQLREAGWFSHCTGFVFGRPCMYQSYNGFTYEEGVMSVLSEMNIPVIFDADIGHKPPSLTIINGSIGTLHVKDGKGSLRQIQS